MRAELVVGVLVVASVGVAPSIVNDHTESPRSIGGGTLTSTIRYPDEPVPVDSRDIVLNASKIVQQVSGSGTLNLSLPDHDLVGTLEPDPLFNTSVHKGHTSGGPVVHSELDNEFFSGPLEGQGTFAQLMTTSWGFSLAYKYNGSWFHLSAADRSKEASDSMVYTSSSITLPDDDGDGNASSPSSSWPCRDAVHDTHVATDHDYEFSKVDNHDERLAEVFNDVDAVWHCDLGIDITIEASAGWHTDSDVLTSYDAGTLLDQLRDHWENTDEHNTGDFANREFVHMLTGRALADGVGGKAYQGLDATGQGCCYSDSEHAYSLNQCDYHEYLPGSDGARWHDEDNPCQRSETDHLNEVIGAHEIGHQFSALHEAADSVCDDSNGCSIMRAEYSTAISTQAFTEVNEESIIQWHKDHARHHHHGDGCPCTQ